jgi:hypothetical protein
MIAANLRSLLSEERLHLGGGLLVTGMQRSGKHPVTT